MLTMANGGGVVGVGGGGTVVAVGVGEVVGINEEADTVLSSRAPCISLRAGAEKSMPQPSANIAAAAAMIAARALRFTNPSIPRF